MSDHVGLALKLRREFFPAADDEYDGQALEILCRAALVWSPDKGSFRGFLASVMPFRLIDFDREWHRERGRSKVNGRGVRYRGRDITVLSTDAEVYSREESDATWLDVFGFCDPDCADEAVDAVDLDRLLRELPPVLVSRAVRSAAGVPQTEIAEQDGVSPAAVSQSFRYSARKRSA